MESISGPTFMPLLAHRAGLSLDFPTPKNAQKIEEVVTEEAAIQGPVRGPARVSVLVGEGDHVSAGAPVACLRDAPDITFVSPIGGRVDRITLLPGRRLSEIVVFRDAGSDLYAHDVSDVGTAAGLRQLMQGSGLWTRLQRRPFGGMPSARETPAAIFVMAVDTRPNAPNPLEALTGREEAFRHGLRALSILAKGPVFLCHAAGASFQDLERSPHVKPVPCTLRHPQGSTGMCVHRVFPAGIDTPIWDIHAEDVAAFGELLSSGVLPTTRLTSISGNAAREARTVRTHPGADMRQLTQRIVKPGQYVLLSGSPLDGRRARWLSARDRQISVMADHQLGKPPHWLVAALSQSASPKPMIPSAALRQAFGNVLPAVPFVRALGAGDDELAMHFGILSLLEEDVALADYVLGEPGVLTRQLRGMLDRIQSELAS